jgi:hypothetical protein
MKTGKYVLPTQFPALIKEKKVNEKESLPIVQRSKILNTPKLSTVDYF